MPDQPVGRSRWHLRRESPPERIVDNLLHRAPLPVDSILHQLGDIWIERQGCPHDNIIVTGGTGIKMSSIPTP